MLLRGRGGISAGGGREKRGGRTSSLPPILPNRKDPRELASRLTARRFVILLTLNTSQFNVAVFFII